jgi:hypothetical protein
MNRANYRREILRKANYASSRELFGFSGALRPILLLCVVLLLASAAERQEKLN